MLAPVWGYDNSASIRPKDPLRTIRKPPDDYVASAAPRGRWLGMGSFNGVHIGNLRLSWVPLPRLFLSPLTICLFCGRSIL
ncbi:MAG: hypothetical protein ACREBC_39620, partial [Pyrinomonadaceae bacterium]